MYTDFNNFSLLEQLQNTGEVEGVTFFLCAINFLFEQRKNC